MVGGHEIDLGAEVRRVVDQPAPRLHEVLVEQGHERRGDVVAHALQARVDVALVELEDLAVVAIEELHVARLVDLLGSEECLLLLVLVGHDETGELRGHAPRRRRRSSAPEVVLLLIVGNLGPLPLVPLEVDAL